MLGLWAGKGLQSSPGKVETTVHILVASFLPAKLVGWYLW